MSIFKKIKAIFGNIHLWIVQFFVFTSTAVIFAAMFLNPEFRETEKFYAFGVASLLMGLASLLILVSREYNLFNIWSIKIYTMLALGMIIFSGYHNLGGYPYNWLLNMSWGLTGFTVVLMLFLPISARLIAPDKSE